MSENFEAQFYDIVIDAKSFEDLGDSGWNVQVSETARQQLDEEEKKNLLELMQKDAKSKTKKGKKNKEESSCEQSVQLEDKVYTKYDQWKSQDRPVIGVIGQGNKGKSFLLSRVADFELPTGGTAYNRAEPC